MSYADCLVDYLLEQGVDEESYIYKKNISQCECPKHADVVLIEPPTIKELNNLTIMVMFDLLNWCKKNPGEKSMQLQNFIRIHCMEGETSLFSILENLSS